MGIGEATAEVFAREGAGLVHVTARSGNLLESLKTRIESSSDCTVQTHILDLTDTGARQTLIDATIDVDILVNNAGAIPSGLDPGAVRQRKLRPDPGPTAADTGRPSRGAATRTTRRASSSIGPLGSQRRARRSLEEGSGNARSEACGEGAVVGCPGARPASVTER